MTSRAEPFKSRYQHRHDSPSGRRGIVLLLPLVLLYCLPFQAGAQVQWAINPVGRADLPGPVASTTNEDGYTLEIYRDAEAVLSRFSLNGLYRLHSCPTYQVDQGLARNLSVDGAPCLSGADWAEFILGRVQNGQIVSPILRALMDGNVLTFRFRLENGDYRETNISLRGSKRSVTTVIGEQVLVRGR